MNKMTGEFGILLHVFLLTVLPLTAAEFCHYFTFDEKNFIITDAVGGLTGRYYPSAMRDNDNANTTNPERYRVPGVKGRALSFKQSLGSYGKVAKFKLPDPTAKLYISFSIKANKNRSAVVVNCKWDSANTGFALFSAGSNWVFYYGNGRKTFHATFRNSVINDQTWLPVELIFDRGRVQLIENGRSLGIVKLAAPAIAANRFPLLIGNYQSLKSYRFEGALDELCIADSAATARKYRGKIATVENIPRIEAICEPVDGNEMHFKGRKVLHTFERCPIPINFYFSADQELFKNQRERFMSPGLVLRVPHGVTVVASYIWSWNPERQLTLPSCPVKVKGQNYTELTLPPGAAGEMRFRRGYPGREILTVALQVPPGFQRGEVYWKVKDAPWNSFELKVLPLPDWAPLPPGKFGVSCSHAPNELYYPDQAVMYRVFELYQQMGVQGLGRNQSSMRELLTREVQVSKKFGFWLNDCNIFEGPQRQIRNLKTPVARAVNAQGQLVPNRYCPSALPESEALLKEYVAFLHKQLPRTGSDIISLDYEPWGEPEKICYCSNCLNRFRKNYHIPETALTPQLIAQKYRREWGLFWRDNTTRIIGFMARAARQFNPKAKLWDYTYLFDYDDPEMAKRFWSIPKDPRQIEQLIDNSELSLYHVRGGKLIDLVDSSRKHLKKSLTGVILLSRANVLQGRYTSPEESLSPQQIYQTIVLLGALGFHNVAFYPGNYIDGAFIPEIGRAVRQVRSGEPFYFQGKRCDQIFQLEGPGRLLAHRLGDRYVVTLFNFSAAPKKFTLHAPVAPRKQSLIVPGNDVKIIKF